MFLLNKTKSSVNAETLHPSPAVQNVLNQLNEKYHYVKRNFHIHITFNFFNNLVLGPITGVSDIGDSRPGSTNDGDLGGAHYVSTRN
jgi:hypothetical protein